MTITTSTFNIVRTGAQANDGTGDDLRAAFTKVNSNFSNIGTIGLTAANISATGAIETPNITVSNTTTSAHFAGEGSLLTNLVVNSASVITTSNTRSSTSTTTGALVITGGAGIGGNLYANSVYTSILGVNGGIGVIGVLGYTAGNGGTVTQGTDKGTAVTLDRTSGNIIMNSAQLNSGANIAFTLTNSTIASSDVLIVNIASGATSGAYRVQVQGVATGSANIALYNVYGSNLSEAIKLNFAVIKAVSE